MVADIGYGTYIFFAFWCILAAVFSYFRKLAVDATLYVRTLANAVISYSVVPETSNLTLEQIDNLFQDDSAREEEAIKHEIGRRVSTSSATHVK